MKSIIKLRNKNLLIKSQFFYKYITMKYWVCIYLVKLYFDGYVRSISHPVISDKFMFPFIHCSYLCLLFFFFPLFISLIVNKIIIQKCLSSTFFCELNRLKNSYFTNLVSSFKPTFFLEITNTSIRLKMCVICISLSLLNVTVKVILLHIKHCFTHLSRNK